MVSFSGGPIIGVFSFDAANNALQPRSASSNEYMEIDPRRHRSHHLVVAMPGIHGSFNRYKPGAQQCVDVPLDGAAIAMQSCGDAGDRSRLSFNCLKKSDPGSGEQPV